MVGFASFFKIQNMHISDPDIFWADGDLLGLMGIVMGIMVQDFHKANQLIQGVGRKDHVSIEKFRACLLGPLLSHSLSVILKLSCPTQQPTLTWHIRQKSHSLDLCPVESLGSKHAKHSYVDKCGNLKRFNELIISAVGS